MIAAPVPLLWRRPPQVGFVPHDLKIAINEAADRSMPLSVARFSFGKDLDESASLDAARLMSRLIRNIDFATRDEEGARSRSPKPTCATRT
jgi:hypothetical protein